ncbi:MAG: carbamoyltransferase HypF, partial [Eubacterium sp.]|nr:carbamoyltransferase HypF [Eubacterium sp.]
ERERPTLGHLCDHILSHNRLIRLRADDTVLDYEGDRPYMIRRSRGYAPLPFSSHMNWQGEVLAIGGELKNTFCLVKNQLYYPSPYLGDMGDVRTVKALEESVRRMEELLEARPQIVACDLHPAYNTSAFARTLGLPVIEVQHHYAHILSCMLENDVEGPVIGVSYDGTGYGTDGTIWGGEILAADYGGFERVASICPFDQVGGDLSAIEGWRNAVTMLKDCYEEKSALKLSEKLNLCDEGKALTLMKMAGRKINTVTSTSAGRLFDAVSALLGICRESTFEGDASCALQYAAQRALKCIRHQGTQGWECYRNLSDRLSEKTWERLDDRWILPTDRLFHELTEAFLGGESSDMLALCFHQILADLTVECCCRIRKERSINAVALSGGVYQNTLLLEETVEGLAREGFRVYTHSMLPPNDGGICVGQAVAAMYALNHQSDSD